MAGIANLRRGILMHRVLFVVLIMGAGPAAAQQTELISINAAGTAAGNGDSGAVLGTMGPRASADGRFVVFESAATDLIPEGTPAGQVNVYLRDRLLGTTTLISRPLPPPPFVPDNNSYSPTITPDGRYVVFFSHHTRLVDLNDFNGGLLDLFRFDTCFGAPEGCVPTMEMVSVNAAGTGSGNASVSIGGGQVTPHPSRTVVVSEDGNRILFASLSNNLVEDFVDGNGGFADLYVRDMALGQTVVITRNAAGTASAAGQHGGYDMDPGGRFVIFHSGAADLTDPPDIDNFADLFLVELQTVESEPLAVPLQAGQNPAQNGALQVRAAIEVTSGQNGSSTEFSLMIPFVPVGDPGENFFVFETSGTNHFNANGEPVPDANGNQPDVVGASFTAGAPGEINLGLPTTLSLNPAGTATVDGPSGDPHLAGLILGPGRFRTVAAFLSRGLDVVNEPPVTDGLNEVYVIPVLDGDPGDTRLVSIFDGIPANADVIKFALSPDGRFVGFTTDADNLGSLSGNSIQLFLRDLGTNTAQQISVAADGLSGADGDSSFPIVSLDEDTGELHIVWVTGASNITNIFIPDGTLQVHAKTVEPPELPTLSVTPAELNYGDLPLGEPSAPQMVAIENIGIVDAHLGTLLLQGAASGDYAITADSCSDQTLPPAGFCGVEVTFTATAPGVRRAQLQIPSDVPGNPQFVALNGSYDVSFADGLED